MKREDPPRRRLYEIERGPQHEPTGKTRHFGPAGPIPPPAILRIEQLDPAPGYYLMHYGADDEEVTDTYHDTLDDAFEQAHWEFGIERAEWTPLEP